MVTCVTFVQSHGFCPNQGIETSKMFQERGNCLRIRIDFIHNVLVCIDVDINNTEECKIASNGMGPNM